jgi:hypothetical protein
MTGCHCPHSRQPAPTAPTPTHEQTAKEFVAHAAVAAVVAVAIEPPLVAPHRWDAQRPTMVTPLELCSEFCRFLL